MTLLVFYMKSQLSYLLSVHYHKNLQLRENELADNEIHFLDLKIIINEENNLKFDLYDKLPDFRFKVDLFTHYILCLLKSVYINILFSLALLIGLKTFVHVKIKIKKIIYVSTQAIN